MYSQMNLLDVDRQDDDNGPEAVVEGMFGAQMTQYQYKCNLQNSND